MNQSRELLEERSANSSNDIEVIDTDAPTSNLLETSCFDIYLCSVQYKNGQSKVNFLLAISEIAWP